MKYILGVRQPVYRKYNLMLQDVYLARYIYFLYTKKLLEPSDVLKEYYVVDINILQKKCVLYVYINRAALITGLQRLNNNFITLYIQTKQRQGKLHLEVETIYNIKINESLYLHAFHKRKPHKKRIQQTCLIKEEYTQEFIEQYRQINAIYNFRHHFNIEKPSQLLLKVQKYITWILNGTFLSNMTFNTTWLKKQNISRLKENVSFDIILYAVKNYAEARAPGGWLANSRSVSLANFFYNPYTKKSLFITLIQPQFFEDVNQIPFNADEIIEFTKAVYTMAQETQLNIQILKENLKPMFLYFKYNYDILKEKNTNQIAWQKVLGDTFKWENFIALIQEYVSNYNVYVGNIRYKTGFWTNFLQYIKEKYSINLSIFK